MLTLNTAQTAAFGKQSCTPVWLVTMRVDVGLGTERELRFTNTDDHVLTDISSACVVSVSPIQSEIDPFTRRFQRGTYEVTFLDEAVIRDLFLSYYVKNMETRILFGESALAESDYITISLALGEDAYISGASMIYTCKDLLYSLLQAHTANYWVINQHPLEVLENIFVRAGIPTAYYNATTFDHTQYTDISHFNVSRFQSAVYYLNKVWTPAYYITNTNSVGTFWDSPKEWAQINHTISDASADKLIDEIADICGGTIQPDQDGVWEFSRYDINAASVATLTVDDFMDFRQITATEDLASRIEFRLGGGDENNKLSFTLYNSSSLANLNAFTGAGGDVNETVTLSSNWLNAIGAIQRDPLQAPITPSDFGLQDLLDFFSDVAFGDAFKYDDTALCVTGWGATGFAGCLVENADYGSQFTLDDASEAVSSARPAYLLIVNDGGNRLGHYTDLATSISVAKYPAGDPNGTEGERILEHEIIRCDSIDFDVLGSFGPQRAIGENWYPSERKLARYTLDTAATYSGRCQFQTSNNRPVFWRRNSLCYDITLAVDIATRHLDRKGYGVAKIQAKLPLSWVHLQPGDVVTIIHDQVISRGINGSDTGVFWEVVRTELTETGIDVLFAFLRGESLTAGDPWVPATVAVESPDVLLTPYFPAQSATDDPITDTTLTIVTNTSEQTLYRA